MGVSSNTHASSTSATKTPKAISQIKKQRTCQIPSNKRMEWWKHGKLTHSEAQIMRDVCRDVQTEPTLLPINEIDYQRKVNTADNARLDISARGLWNSCEKNFFDIRITHPTSQSYSGKSLAEVYQQHEKEKKDKYNQRVIDIEKSSFNPLVFTTTGGWHQNATE